MQSNCKKKNYNLFLCKIKIEDHKKIKDTVDNKKNPFISALQLFMFGKCFKMQK